MTRVRYRKQVELRLSPTLVRNERWRRRNDDKVFAHVSNRHDHRMREEY
jgi:hypothetical protein